MLRTVQSSTPRPSFESAFFSFVSRSSLLYFHWLLITFSIPSMHLRLLVLRKISLLPAILEIQLDRFTKENSDSFIICHLFLTTCSPSVSLLAAGSRLLDDHESIVHFGRNTPIFDAFPRYRSVFNIVCDTFNPYLTNISEQNILACTRDRSSGTHTPEVSFFCGTNAHTRAGNTRLVGAKSGS